MTAAARDPNPNLNPMTETSGNNPTAMNRGPWTSNEITTLRNNAHHGATHIANLLNRTPWSVRRAAHRLRISLRPPGEHRGRILGETHPGQLPRPVRATYLANPDLATTVHAELHQALTNPPPLCPLCARWEVRPGHETCRVCELDALTAAHHRKMAEERAQRRVDALRQQRSRENRTAARQQATGRPTATPTPAPDPNHTHVIPSRPANAHSPEDTP